MPNKEVLIGQSWYCNDYPECRFTVIDIRDADTAVCDYSISTKVDYQKYKDLGIGIDAILSQCTLIEIAREPTLPAPRLSLILQDL